MVVAPEWYSAELHRPRTRARLRRINLHGLRNTNVSLMLDHGHPPHIVAAWHGHDSTVARSIYADVKADELRAVGTSLFGRPKTSLDHTRDDLWDTAGTLDSVIT